MHLILFTIACQQIACVELFERQEDLLKPYIKIHADRKRSHRYVRECQHVIHGNKTFVVHNGSNLTGKPSVDSLKYLTHKVTERKSVFEIKNRYVHGHIAVVNNPAKTFSVLYPKDERSCTEQSGIRDTVSTTSTMGKCLLATNAGFFKTHSGGCLGNIVSNGHLVHDSQGIQNANFGIRKDGSIVTGYLPEDEVIRKENGFQQLVSGVGWLVRDGEIYVNESKKAECADTEETGTIDRFFNVISARTAIGHDKYGRIVLAQIDGKTDVDGVNLLEFAKLLKKHGVVNAINLDGGGSSTFVVNGTLSNYPSDMCGTDISCERKVSTIICIHEPDPSCNCSDPQCNDAACVLDKNTKRNHNAENATEKANDNINSKRITHYHGPVFGPDLENEANYAPDHPRSFMVIWFVALSALLGCSLLTNVFLVNMVRSRKPKEKPWKTSDLRSLLDEDSDGV